MQESDEFGAMQESDEYHDSRDTIANVVIAIAIALVVGFALAGTLTKFCALP